MCPKDTYRFLMFATAYDKISNIFKMYFLFVMYGTLYAHIWRTQALIMIFTELLLLDSFFGSSHIFSAVSWD